MVQAFLKKWWVSESDCRKENTNPTQNQPNKTGPKILGDMIQSRNAVVDKKPNEVSYEQPKRINRNINSEPHSFADTRVKKTLKSYGHETTSKR